MTISLTDIIDQSSGSYNTWNSLFNNENYENKLLFPLSPIIDYTFSEIQKNLIKKHKLHALVDRDFLEILVIRFFKDEIGLLVNRTFVLELHNTKKANILKANSSKKRFNEFIEIISSKEALKLIIKKYLPLENAISTCINQFITQIDLFFFRMSKDLPDIEDKIILRSIDTLKLINIQYTGDKHQHGKRVIIASLEDKGQEIKFVYKPRDLSLIKQFGLFLDWINEKTEFNFTLPYTVVKKDYGWQRFIKNNKSNNKHEVGSFFYHLGGLLGIFHLLNTQDIHSENIIADGKNPVLVDCECLLTPTILQNKEENTRKRNLVCSSLVLPARNMHNNNYSGFDNSVIGNEPNQTLPFKKISWSNAGTDEMVLKRSSSTTIVHKCRPILEGAYANPLDFNNHFIKGFKNIYRFFLKNKLNILDEKNSPINCFRNCISRVIIRPTNHYAKLIIEGFHPALLYNTKERLFHYNFLDESISNTPEFKKFLTSEKSSLEELNIPIFYSSTSERNIFDSDKNKIDVTIIQTPLEHALSNFSDFWSENDLNIQMAIILNSFSTLEYNNKKRKKNSLAKIEIESKTILPTNTILEDLSELIYEHTIKDNGYISWPTIIPAGSKITQSITDNTLYNGGLGIAYVLSLCGHFTNKRKYQTLSREYLDYIIDYSINNDTFRSIGLYDGLGGLIYCLPKISKLDRNLNRNHINTLIQKFDTTLTGEVKIYDVMSGYSGFLLSLISIKDFIDESIFIKYSQICKDKLMKITDQLTLPSYAHGVTGAYRSLYRLYQITKEKEILPIINRFISIEESLYNREKGYWVDNRNTDETKSSHAWCHGSVGIGMAKLDLSDDNIFIQQNKYIDSSIVSTLENGFQTDFSLCHGHTGSLDFLLEAKLRGRLTNHSSFDNYLNKYLQCIQDKSFTFYNIENTFIPGLFDGISGIIYFLLRIQFGKEIPSILMV